MKASHTPGPWDADHGDIWNRSGRKFVAATMEDGEPFKGCSAAEAEANARLISAAPELLEALKALVADYKWSAGHKNGGYAESHPITKAKAALSKATGA